MACMLKKALYKVKMVTGEFKSHNFIYALINLAALPTFFATIF